MFGLFGLRKRVGELERQVSQLRRDLRDRTSIRVPTPADSPRYYNFAPIAPVVEKMLDKAGLQLDWQEAREAGPNVKYR